MDPKYRDAPLRLAAVGRLLPAQAPFYADAAPAAPATVAERVPPTPAPVAPAPLSLAPAAGGYLDSDTRRIIPERYQLEEPLGSGSMGVVYRGRDTLLDRPVAVKVLNSGLADAETLRRYFLREAKVMASLNHPHIVTIFDVGANEAAPYLVMEYLSGSDLTGPAERREISEGAALRYTAQVASALGAVHGRGFLHRDVKPANVFLLKDEDRVKLMDFGVARGLSGSSTAIVGTPDYMAPEQILGEELGPWTDIYALGGMLFTLLTGEAPFAGGNALAQAIKNSASRSPDCRAVDPGRGRRGRAAVPRQEGQRAAPLGAGAWHPAEKAGGGRRVRGGGGAYPGARTARVGRGVTNSLAPEAGQGRGASRSPPLGPEEPPKAASRRTTPTRTIDFERSTSKNPLVLPGGRAAAAAAAPAGASTSTSARPSQEGEGQSHADDLPSGRDL